MTRVIPEVYESAEHLLVVRSMLDNLDMHYQLSKTADDFIVVRSLLNAFRGVVMCWTDHDFSTAYDLLSEWQKTHLETNA